MAYVQPQTLEALVPDKLVPLAEPARYKAAYGGRGGAKSHFFAELLITRCLAKGTRAVCIREVQKDLRDSVRQLLVDKIQKFNLGWFFDVREAEIRAPNGSLIIFRGMQNYNAENIKSLENFDIAWVEEAQVFSERSLRLLRPTIRAEGSEIWFSWNPRFDTDAVDMFFRKNPPPNAIIVPINWYDNPFFPTVLQEEKDADFANDPEMAEHVWNGGYEIISEQSYFARLLAQLERQGHVGRFPYDPALPVHTSWDIGVDDYTSIFFWQTDGETVSVVDYYESSGLGAEDIIRQALPEHLADEREMQTHLLELGRDQPWKYGVHFFPHDIRNREWGAGAKSRVEIVAGLGLKGIRKGAATDPANRIAATRALLPITYFDQNPRVMLGLSRLRRYSRKKNDQLGTYLGPLHDQNSHAADAFGEFAMNFKVAPQPVAEKKKPQPIGTVVLQGPPEPPDLTMRGRL